MKLQKTLVAIPVLMAATVLAQSGNLLPQGAEVRVRTDTAIPAHPPENSKYSATVANDVIGRSGQVAIPRGSRGQLVAVPSPDGKDVVLDLESVTVNGQEYRLVAPGEKTGPEGLGANKRTAKYVGGGAAVGAVLGALLGGGKGAGIGAILGGAGGAGAEVLRGKKKEIPAETELKYKLAQELEMRSASEKPSEGLQTRPESNQQPPQQHQ